MKKVILTAATVALGLGMTQASAQSDQVVTPETQNSKKQNAVVRAFSDMKESAATISKINKENLAEEKYAFMERNTQATEPDSGIMKLKETKGFKNKLKVIGTNMKQTAQENSEKEKVRREQIKSHESYRNLMQGQREFREAIINRG